MLRTRPDHHHKVNLLVNGLVTLLVVQLRGFVLTADCG
jgi:hypothetical protein